MRVACFDILSVCGWSAINRSRSNIEVYVCLLVCYSDCHESPVDALLVTFLGCSTNIGVVFFPAHDDDFGFRF